MHIVTQEFIWKNWGGNTVMSCLQSTSSCHVRRGQFYSIDGQATLLIGEEREVIPSNDATQVWTPGYHV